MALTAFWDRWGALWEVLDDERLAERVWAPGWVCALQHEHAWWCSGTDVECGIGFVDEVCLISAANGPLITVA